MSAVAPLFPAMRQLIPAALLAASGASALCYEVLWAKRLAVLLGGTAEAHCAVLVIFLGGLALGSIIFGRAADRARSPLALYGILELGAAALAAMSPAVLDAAAGLPLAGRWGAAFCALTPAVLLLGGSLPALSRWTTASLDELTGVVSRLAFMNAFGAAAGALAAGVWLAPAAGLAGGVRLAAALNAAAGAGALLLARSVAPRPEEAPWSAAPLSRAPLAAAALAGCVTLLLETAWIRLLGLALGSTVHAFALMTASFILGICSGALAVERGWLRRRDPGEAFALCQLGSALAVLIGLPLYARLPHLAFSIGGLVPREPGWYPAFEGLRFLLCLTAAAPAAFFAGAAMPFAARAAATASGSVGRAVGAAYGANAAGNAAGAVLGMVLLPGLGLAGLLAMASAGSAAGGMLLAPRRWRVGLAAVAVMAALSPALNILEPRLLSSGTFHGALPRGVSWRDFRAVFLSETLLFHRDDRHGTVVVVETGGRRYLKVNGKTDASDGGDMRTQILVALIPLRLKPDAREVLIVGLGSGVTAAAALKRREAEVTVVEISPAVVSASRHFEHATGRPLSDPRLRLSVGDAGLFLRRPGQAYDLVVSEPSNPWMAGVASLFTADFYAAVRRRLNPGGVMAQWFHLYEMSEEALTLVLRTFAASFPAVEAWDLGGGDVLLLGSDAALPTEPGELGGARRVMRDAGLRVRAGVGPLHTDDRPLLEHLAPKALFLDAASSLAPQGL